jgi:hypothetical protein
MGVAPSLVGVLDQDAMGRFRVGQRVSGIFRLWNNAVAGADGRVGTWPRPGQPEMALEAEGVGMEVPTDEVEQPQVVRSSAIAVPMPKQASDKNDEYT